LQIGLVADMKRVRERFDLPSGKRILSFLFSATRSYVPGIPTGLIRTESYRDNRYLVVISNMKPDTYRRPGPSVSLSSTVLFGPTRDVVLPYGDEDPGRSTADHDMHCRH
jgi:hypothetical protein